MCIRDSLTIIIINNSTQGDGGVLSCDGRTIIQIIGNRFTNNAANNGGVVYTQSGSLTLNDNYFANAKLHMNP